MNDAGEPVAGAEVVIDDGDDSEGDFDETATTDSDGKWAVRTPAGDFVIRASFPKHSPASLPMKITADAEGADLVLAAAQFTVNMTRPN